MPNTKSAKKQVRVSGKRKLRNQSIRSQNKTVIKKAEGLIFSGKVKEAEEEVKKAVSSLDKAAGKGILHANNAGRRKARLVKKLNQAKTKAAS
ncbi:30S ribosomal protein S20 [Chloroflexota bacterium]